MRNFRNRFIRKQKKQREIILDLLKGIAVITMIIAHSVAFFSNGEIISLEILQKIGDTISFSIFLFASSASIYLAYLNTNSEVFYSTKIPKIKKRTIRLVLVYYLVAFLSTTQYWHGSIFTIVKYILRIILFIQLPGYTEFILPFIFYSIGLLIFYRFFKVISKGISISLFLGFSFFFIGAYFSLITVNPLIAPVKLILFGEHGKYSFPLFQYFLVFVLGLNFGYILSKVPDILKRQMFLTRALMYYIFAFLAYIIFEIVYLKIPFSINSLQYRWPPSLEFLSIGIVAVYVLSIILNTFCKSKHIVSKILQFLGRNVFKFYFIHISILQVYAIFNGPKIDNLLWVSVMFILLNLLTGLIIIFINSLKEKENNSEYFRSRSDDGRVQTTQLGFSLNMKILFSLFSIIIFIIFAYSFYSYSRSNTHKHNLAEEITIDLADLETKYTWWDDFSPYKRLLIVKNLSSNELKIGSKIGFEFNHANLALTNKSLQSGKDLKIVYFDGGGYREVPIRIISPNQQHTKIEFKLVSNINALSEDGNYFMYYGDLKSDSYLVDNSFESVNKNAKIKISQEIIHPLIASTDKLWVLKGDELSSNMTSLKFFVTPQDNDTLYDLDYTILGTNIFGKMTYNTDSGIYEAIINTDILLPGEYKIQAKDLTSNDIKSSVSYFKVSYPLYVVWTIDWEGYATKKGYLDKMDNLANKHQIPFTHFYNPRIYVAKDISKNNINMTDDWIKYRAENFNDEVGLHLHGFFDMARACNVPVKTSNRWGGYSDGKDVPMTEWNEDEMVKILQWSKNMLAQHGFNNIYSYRSGAWFVNLDTLKALERAGFKIDSSGRDYYKWGANKIEGFWNLNYTTQPYRPNLYNQNSSAQPNFTIWEFPNNGGDSWNNTANDMIRRFDLNYNKDILNKRKIVIYLSHPHWFNVDEPKMDELLTYIDQFLYTNDNGPVLYTTLQNSAKGWGIHY